MLIGFLLAWGIGAVAVFVFARYVVDDDPWWFALLAALLWPLVFAVGIATVPFDGPDDPPEEW